jgi:hypothetical protein
METLRSKAQAQKKTVFKTIFDSPHSQWPILDDATEAELLKRSLEELARFSGQLSRSTSRPKGAKRAKLEETTDFPILVGLNQTTRELEKKTLAAVLACRADLLHSQLLHHLPFQARLSGCRLVPLPKGSANEISALLGLPRVTVIGIREHPDTMNLLKTIRNRIPEETADLSAYQKLIIKRVPVQSKKSKSPRKPLERTRRNK